MKFNNARLLLILLLLLIGTVLAACSGSGDEETGGDGDDGDTEATEDSGGSGGTLVFGRGGDSTSLDPSRTTEGETFKVTKNIFETLLEFEDGGTEIVPGLAHDWDVSDDGLKYIFDLDELINFYFESVFNDDIVVDIYK